VIVVAAGSGTRVGGEVPKQFLSVAGTPVLLRAIRPFASHPDVAHIVVVLPAADADAPPGWLAPLIGDTLRVVAGGRERGDSVAAGLAALDRSCEIVLVHDGARPFPPRTVIDEAIAMARSGHGAVPAIPVADTIKRADRYGQILSTVDRDGLWRAQTPQAFPRALLARAHAAAHAEGVQGTDDAALVERLGERVELIAGSSRNVKITTPDDVILASWLAEHP
jgi:2-C-methyl-D-erythritol 4-phosphate cytidylyltransferase